MKPIKPIILVILALTLNGCVVLLPAKQKVQIVTKDKDATVYIDNEEVGHGSTITTKVKKNGSHSVVVQTPNGKDMYYSLNLTKKRTWVSWVLAPIDFFLPPYYGLLVHFALPKTRMFPKTFDAYSKQLSTKKSEEKHLRLDAIKLDIKDKTKDLTDYYLTGVTSENLMKEIEKAESKKQVKDEKKEKKEKAKKKLTEDQDIKYDDTKFSEDVFRTMKKAGYIDTVNQVFNDENNTLHLEGVITKASLFHVTPVVLSAYAVSPSTYYKTKVYVKWYIKSQYDEIVDSIVTTDYSGEHLKNDYKMYADAMNNSYLNLFNNSTFKKYLKAENVGKIADDVMSIKAPTAMVTSLQEAAKASVTIKRKDKGHGTGFAISNDGYILTNYHVIAGEMAGKLEEIKVMLTTGEELPVTVVRTNKFKDVALLKVNHNFEKAYKLSNVKTFTSLQEVYTVGTPKSIELGQSVSTGLISNERNTNNNNLLQVSMPVNAGNSGGPLFDKTGNLHGIVTSKLYGFSTEGISFSIPTYMVSDYLNLKIQ